MDKRILILFFFFFIGCEELTQQFLQQAKLLFANECENGTTFMIATYNVENLFDTEDDPHKNDNAFTPGGKYRWTKRRYRKKLKQIAKVINRLNEKAPLVLLELVEIENRKVLEDLVQLLNFEVGIVHRESDDRRGIDVALLYRKDWFKVLQVQRLPNPPQARTTRNILYVRGTLKGVELHVFLNHWPSRRGGEKKTFHKRVAMARLLRRKVDKILAKDPDAAILIMGDFNDYPDDVSLRKALKATPHSHRNATLCNLAYATHEACEEDAAICSHCYRKHWGMLDQIIISQSLCQGIGNLYLLQEAQAFYTPDMLYSHPRYGLMPNRTFSGVTYHADGYSDHLPVYTLWCYTNAFAVK